MLKKYLPSLVFLATAGVVIVVIAVISGRGSESGYDDDDYVKSNAPAEVGGNPAGTSTAAMAYTLSDVATHATPENCWTAIRDSVYDVTAWISKHPGGDKNILKTCGIDATSLFVNKHGGQENPEKALESFKIGSFSK